MLSFGAAAPAAHAQSVQLRGVPNPTYDVLVFGRLEQSLAEAVSRRDSKELDALISPSFMLVVGTKSGPLLKRSEWLPLALQEPPFDSAIEHLSTASVGSTTIVSFAWTVKPHEAAPVTISVVDMWVPAAGTDNKQLQLRYATPSTEAMNIPGVVQGR
jgi:hypothetical protein